MAVNEMRWGILYCPKRGMFRSGLSWNRVEKCLKENGIEFDFIQSENTGSVDRLIKMLINNGYKTIVIIGGDSALNDAVNSLMQVDKTTRDSVALGVIPNGLMNDFAHFWGLKEGEIETTIKSLKKRRIRKIDLGYIRYNNRKGEICRRYFLNCRIDSHHYESSSPNSPSLRLTQIVFYFLFYFVDFSKIGVQDAFENQRGCLGAFDYDNLYRKCHRIWTNPECRSL